MTSRTVLWIRCCELIDVILYCLSYVISHCCINVFEWSETIEIQIDLLERQCLGVATVQGRLNGNWIEEFVTWSFEPDIDGILTEFWN